MAPIQQVYLAHNYEAREWLQNFVCPVLKNHGIDCTSRWLSTHGGTKEDHAVEDCQDIDIADAVVVFVDPFAISTGRGKWFEFGYAVAHDIPVFLVGDDTACVFSHLPTSWCVYRVKDVDAAVQALKTWGAGL